MNRIPTIFVVHGTSVNAIDLQGHKVTIGKNSIFDKHDINIDCDFFPIKAGQFYFDGSNWSFKNTQNKIDILYNRHTFINEIVLHNNDVITFYKKHFDSDEDAVIIFFLTDVKWQDTQWKVKSFHSHIDCELDSDCFFMNNGDLWINGDVKEVYVNQEKITGNREIQILDHISIADVHYFVLLNTILVHKKQNLIQQNGGSRSNTGNNCLSV